MPDHFKALFNRGFAFDKLGEYDKAIQDYSKAIQIDPMNAFAYYNKGISLDRKGDYKLAIESFTSAIEIEPNKSDFYHN
jgi:tetratricopeptide (TPR) repeat protein